jgi:transcriptional regulator with XRE-family HTH domain
VATAEVKSETLGQRLVRLRKARDLTQRAAAKRIGVSNQALYIIETGQGNPRMDTLVNLADLYDVSTDMLLGRLDD